jgi:AraC-like DNA-binding protein
MKAIFEKITIEDLSSVRVYDFQNTHFDAPWHFHPEFELTLILKSKGKRYVGSSINPFQEGDLVLIGPNLPHIWKNNFKKLKKHKEAKAIVIHFTEEFTNGNFFNYKEMNKIKKLLYASRYGLIFDANSVDKIIPTIKKLPALEGFDKILAFLSVLHKLSVSPNILRLNGNGFLPNLDTNSSERINKVCKFIYANFNNKITLTEMANLAGMSENAFSRYFKNLVGTSLSKFIIQVRVNHACYLLIESDLTVAEISYECGFHSISNFNKRFKNVSQISANAFRKNHNEKT